MTPDFPDSETLRVEADGLHLPRFTETEALDLGRILVDLALKRGHALIVNIRTPDRTLFHAALPGSAPLNDRWAARKSATAFFFQEASLAVGVRNRAKGETLERHGLDPSHYADAGGAVPLRVSGAGVVAVVTVSGLPQLEDHKLVVEGIRALIAGF